MARVDDHVIGLDLGTSGIKAVLMSAQGALLAEAVMPLTVSRPQPLWSEQAPADWWAATDAALLALRAQVGPSTWQSVRALAVAGQMHGAVVLDADGEVLRPAILWNDGRSQDQCVELEAREPLTRQLTANRAMAGFTAPKLMWLAAHEPDVFARITTVLLPKDWLVWRLTGVKSSDMSDAAGTLWLDVARRDWSAPMLKVTGMQREQMPTLHEGPDVVAPLQAHCCQRWGLSNVHVAAGAGDNAAGAVGLGIVEPGDGFISLGTSGVIFVATATAQANPERGVHTFCHALPNTWHQMAVMLSAASALSWWADITQVAPAELLAPLLPGVMYPDAPIFLPYLSGERTPHADPAATGSFIGLTAAHKREALTYAVLEGVAFAFADGLHALREGGANPTVLLAIGGGARSDTWLQLLADVLNLAIERPQDAEVGPALGAARLALLSLGHAATEVLQRPAQAQRFMPDNQRHVALMLRRHRFRQAYAPLRALSSAPLPRTSNL